MGEDFEKSKGSVENKGIINLFETKGSIQFEKQNIKASVVHSDTQQDLKVPSTLSFFTQKSDSNSTVDSLEVNLPFGGSILGKKRAKVSLNLFQKEESEGDKISQVNRKFTEAVLCFDLQEKEDLLAESLKLSQLEGDREKHLFSKINKLRKRIIAELIRNSKRLK